MCDIRCLKAKTPKSKCKCECKGANHGVLSDKKVIKTKTKNGKITVELENGSILVFDTYEKDTEREKQRVKKILNELLVPQLQNPNVVKVEKPTIMFVLKQTKQTLLTDFFNDIKVV